jgi:hypothetical protein
MDFIDGKTLHKVIHEQKERPLVPSVENIASQLVHFFFRWVCSQRLETR